MFEMFCSQAVEAGGCVPVWHATMWQNSS